MPWNQTRLNQSILSHYILFLLLAAFLFIFFLKRKENKVKYNHPVYSLFLKGKEEENKEKKNGKVFFIFLFNFLLFKKKFHCLLYDLRFTFSHHFLSRLLQLISVFLLCFSWNSPSERSCHNFCIVLCQNRKVNWCTIYVLGLSSAVSHFIKGCLLTKMYRTCQNWIHKTERVDFISVMIFDEFFFDFFVFYWNKQIFSLL